VRRRLAFLAIGALLALAPLAFAEDAGPVGAQVSVEYGAVAPAQVDVLPGEAVQWSNDSVRQHTVTADDGSFDSGTLSPTSEFTHVFRSTGTFTYHCRLHPYIVGEVDVLSVLLDRPVAPASAGKPFPLSGRAAATEGDVAIEFDDGSGSGFQPAGTASIGPDGHFVANITPATSGSYRAVFGDAVSPPVDLLVLNRSISAQVRGSRVTATVSPASPGATVVLQLYLKQRFGWWPVQQTKLNKASRATFRLGRHRAVSARVVLTLPDGATVLATSTKLHLRASK
jgi:plastocyanin